MDEIYTGIVADIARLARKLAKTETYESANGSTALLTFSDHLEGIVAAVGVYTSKGVRISVHTKETLKDNQI